MRQGACSGKSLRGLTSQRLEGLPFLTTAGHFLYWPPFLTQPPLTPSVPWLSTEPKPLTTESISTPGMPRQPIDPKFIISWSSGEYAAPSPWVPILYPCCWPHSLPLNKYSLLNCNEQDHMGFSGLMSFLQLWAINKCMQSVFYTSHQDVWYAKRNNNSYHWESMAWSQASF